MTRNKEQFNPISATDKPYTTKIKKIIQNTPSIKTFLFDFAPDGFPVNILPGQFLMVWIPDVDEIPMSVSYIGPGAQLGITVQKVGDATNKMHNLMKGDYIGIRGPYGNSFIFNHDYSIIIGGGVGTAPLRELVKGIAEYSKLPTIVINGAKTKSELLYHDEFKNYKENIIYYPCTDDGTLGFSGFVTDLFEQKCKEFISQAGDPSKITVYTCGPEIMMKKIFDICVKNNIKIQASLERMMRCGFGLCGLCVLEPMGMKVCQDGPVFDTKILLNIHDFGKFYRDMTGKKIFFT
ncbi:MAG: dihydroorotate dehydrogenase electron transfer subunit [Promethearchaeota archaeon]